MTDDDGRKQIVNFRNGIRRNPHEPQELPRAVSATSFDEMARY